MKKIVFINNASKKQCGVFNFGKNTAKQLFNETWGAGLAVRYPFEYIESDSEVELKDDVSYCILNLHQITLPWVQESWLKKYPKVKFMALWHDQIIDFPSIVRILHPNPLFINEDKQGKHRGVLRPITYRTYEVPQSSIPIISTFGFGFPQKGYGELLGRINHEFKDEEVIVRYNIPLNSQVGGFPKQMADELRNYQAQQNNKVQLIVTDDYKSEEDLLYWLSESSINIFMNRKTESVTNGLSSAVEYGVGAIKPICVTSDRFFDHINKLNDYECSIDKKPTSIKEIMAKGTKPLEYFYNNWTQKKLLCSYLDVIEELNNGE